MKMLYLLCIWDCQTASVAPQRAMKPNIVITELFLGSQTYNKISRPKVIRNPVIKVGFIISLLQFCLVITFSPYMLPVL